MLVPSIKGGHLVRLHVTATDALFSTLLRTY